MVSEDILSIYDKAIFLLHLLGIRVTLIDFTKHDDSVESRVHKGSGEKGMPWSACKLVDKQTHYTHVVRAAYATFRGRSPLEQDVR